MMDYQFDLVGKIGSMALIRKEDKDIDYNIFSRLGAELKPGMIWVTSGATEIGRLDYLKRTGCELCGSDDEIKADYAAQGQSILMQNYRQFIHQEYGVRQLLVEHTHFNDPEKREHIRRLLIRAAQQKTIPIVNYNDPVSDEENRKMELAIRRSHGDQVVECVDNDETAAVIANLVHAKKLVLTYMFHFLKISSNRLLLQFHHILFLHLRFPYLLLKIYIHHLLLSLHFFHLLFL